MTWVTLRLSGVLLARSTVCKSLVLATLVPASTPPITAGRALQSRTRILPVVALTVGTLLKEVTSPGLIVPLQIRAEIGFRNSVVSVTVRVIVVISETVATKFCPRLTKIVNVKTSTIVTLNTHVTTRLLAPHESHRSAHVRKRPSFTMMVRLPEDRMVRRLLVVAVVAWAPLLAATVAYVSLASSKQSPRPVDRRWKLLAKLISVRGELAPLIIRIRLPLALLQVWAISVRAPLVVVQFSRWWLFRAKMAVNLLVALSTMALPLLTVVS